MPTLVVHSPGGDSHVAVVRHHRIAVDQAEADGGLDSGPTPVELFVASLATCVAHYATRALRAPDGPGVRVECSWEMSAAPPWRVAAVAMEVVLPETTTDARRAAVERAVSRCTVHNSIVDAPAMRTVTRVTVRTAA